MVDKLSAFEAKRRVNILRAVRTQLRVRFMKVFRLFRHKKYGEPLEPPKPIQSSRENGSDSSSPDLEEIKIRRMKN